MKYNLPYLNDKEFLQRFNNLRIKQQFVKIIVLNFDQVPIDEIEGRITGGSINVDGSSSMRRTANLSFVADECTNTITNAQNIISINKKIDLLIGFKNITDQYIDYSHIWFPQGTFVIINANIVRDINGLNINLTLHDKMALLNGQCGGVLPASITFHQMEDIDQDGNEIIVQPTIVRIIRQLVNHWGKQQLGKIIINDLDQRIRQVMQWTGTNPLKMNSTSSGNNQEFSANLNVVAPEVKIQTEVEVTSETGIGQERIFYNGDDVGYILTDFVYPGQLISNIGDTVTSVLDTIINVLGNYEYFYDIDGNFIFQQKKNYLNNSYSSDIDIDVESRQYSTLYMYEKSKYYFNYDTQIITSYTNTPQYNQIKNDFLIWGIRKTTEDMEIPIRYHLAIDKKPTVGNNYEVFFYTDPYDGIKKAKSPIYLQKLINVFDNSSNNNNNNNQQQQAAYESKIRNSRRVLCEVENVNQDNIEQEQAQKILDQFDKAIKELQSLDDVTQKTITITNVDINWVGDTNQFYSTKSYVKYDNYTKIKKVEQYALQDRPIYRWDPQTRCLILTNYKLQTVTATDYRSELYFSGVTAEPTGVQSNDYYIQLKTQWPKMYDVQNGKYYEEYLNDPSRLDYFLDIIDTSAQIAPFGVDSIGRRTQVIVDNTINCIFQPDPPNVILIQVGTDITQTLRNESIKKGYIYSQIPTNIYSLLAAGGILKSAYQLMRGQLYQYISYNNQISLSTIPIYYLQPNTRITVMDQDSDIYGDYIIKSLSIPLDINGTMNISCFKAVQRI